MTKLIPDCESLTVEFKSDRDRLPDRDLVAAVICLANSEGGDVFVGVEDVGTVTGLHAAHRNVAGLAAMIANSTVPPLSVRVEALEVDGHSVAKITVPKSRQLVATSKGLLQRRRIKADGLPECVPFYPHEFARRQSDLGLVDYSALPVAAATSEDFDPLERERLRQAVERYGGDRSLLGLSDDELDGALAWSVSRKATRDPPWLDLSCWAARLPCGGTCRPTKLPSRFWTERTYSLRREACCCIHCISLLGLVIPTSFRGVKAKLVLQNIAHLPYLVTVNLNFGVRNVSN